MDQIVNILKEKGKAMTAFDMAEAMGAPVDETVQSLNALVSEGRVIVTKKNKYALPESAGLVAARTLVLRSGAPVARPLDGGRDMLIRDRGNLRPIVDDLLLVAPEPHSGERMGHCRLQAITRRAHEQFTAVYRLARVEIEERPRARDNRKNAKRRKKREASAPVKAAFVPELTPTDPRIFAKMELVGGHHGAASGDMVLLSVVSWPERGQPMRVQIERVLGDADDVHSKLMGIVLSHGIPSSFPEPVVEEASAMPGGVQASDYARRADLRGMTLFTIDGDDAQDFDDAVSLEVMPDGYKLGVHIADVSSYVKRKSPIDREALERGTSVYLPGLTIPMLPEALSNGLCSLMPDVDRLAMSLIMTVKGGKVADHLLTPSVIHSRARLTYAQVNRLFAGEENDVPSELHDVLRQMNELAGALRAARHARGSIDFDLPETAFTLSDAGDPIDVKARERGEAERLIEDFMLLANETVAELARTAELPLIYRVHDKPDPDRVRTLETFLARLGIKVRLGTNPSPGKLQKVLREAKGMGESALIEQVVLKSLRRAEYAAAPRGHYGLAARDYCHFTSPIRRYPDLEVHRMLKLHLAGETKSLAKHEARMPELAAHCSAREQRATMAERDADDLLKAVYMSNHIGEEFSGVVTGVTAWGYYVTLQNTVTGLVPIRALSAAYALDESQHALTSPGKPNIRLGDPARVVLDRVNLALSQIDFAPA